MSTTLEQAVRLAWLGWGGYSKWTICARCGEPKHCRSRGGARFLCLECFDQR